jgi:hypothetical protein
MFIFCIEVRSVAWFFSLCYNVVSITLLNKLHSLNVTSLLAQYILWTFSIALLNNTFLGVD